ncbi:MAG TPA: outer membrane beta-barrel protein [Bryobacteraceae bacterium]|jgi:hypothetical protein
MRSIFLVSVAAAAFVMPQCLFAQRVSFGFVGGTNITHDFHLWQFPYQSDAYPGGLTTFELFSKTHTFIAGFSTEVQIHSGFSFEADALHRTLNLELQSVLPDRSILPDGTENIITWEFPLLLKYRLPLAGPVHPFINAGPSFRTRKNTASTEPSQFGGTVGAGVEFQAGRLRISPAIRYTRWQYDGDFPLYATKPDQFEFVTGVSYATSMGNWRVGRRAVQFGLIGGTSFTGGVAGRYAAEKVDERQGYIGGLALEVEARKRLSIEVNGLYRPFRTAIVTPGGPAGDYRFDFTIVTWEFPLLAKYTFQPQAKIRPFVEAGPSFRLSGNRNGSNPSSAGITLGGGFQTNYGVMKVSPVLRYTRWADDSGTIPGGFLTKPNQVELLVAFTF